MSDEPADRSPSEGGLSDLAFPAGFGTAAVLLTAIWFAFIGWIAWLPLHFFFGWIFG
ncbi:hypothetical protein EDE08_104639 [Bradyrhizobium sp. R2.2-H]|uniref:hypothetical protein n=1 Tax=unclassified Bradyrhizobium TaxID=2631580 RepID=UPI0010E3E4C4|nr:MULTISPECIES: hypothetical protein [unclassified Bradyrhizobium]TCU73349.1 hypothetical protein EDE10_1044 [Bradyrhizobium sp. Y-H1]TCU76462.1 hypothetical protein EDE08_104639 [Bradyrhizobium sp. R2.2-H]